jgi:hypothetical protein
MRLMSRNHSSTEDRKRCPVRSIAERNVLLRVRVELPEGIKLSTKEFQEGWSLARRVDAYRLEMRILTRGWNFIKIGDGSLRAGVGETSQEAIACALRLSLRCASERSNAMTFENIALTQYPWFFLARVRAHPYRIQKGVALPAPDDAGAPPTDFPRKWSGREPVALHPHFGRAMPTLKETLVLSRSIQGREL